MSTPRTLFFRKKQDSLPVFSASQHEKKFEIQCKIEKRTNFDKICLCGDVKKQPGPTKNENSTKVNERRISFPCSVCQKGVTKASKAILCDNCDKWTHVRCTNISLQRYNECVQTGDDIPFVCEGCSWTSLPFHDDDFNDKAAEADATQASAASSQNQVNSDPSFASIPKILSQKGLHFLHANVRSLLPRISEVRHLLSRTRASIFVATETWLDSTLNNREVAVPDFEVVRLDRNRNGGGVALYVRNDLAFNIRPDLAVDGLEATWVEILLPKTKGILICGCYRPPTDNNFLSRMEQSLSKVGPGSEHEYRLLRQMVNEPTRVTTTTALVIDHVVVSLKDKVKEVGLISYGFSDHLIVYCSRGIT